ncbi:hypothetical protein [Bifidobacterium felsineum]|uniref:hypothetical protein n=1 Tax=Bifidobacterium felsineum TaxID=2045440 RepID=UPI001BDBCD04|nr:hypothetical protein [Bifidobacterium felsineum]MBT1164956.1 hypothetical protein [Bifidobacterium felsineum]
MMVDDATLGRLADAITDHPNRWVSWPEPFESPMAADRRMRSLRDGADPAFRVDPLLFRWRSDDLRNILAGNTRRYWIQITCIA